MTAAQGAQVSEAQIAVHWREEEYYHPPAKFVAQANGSDPALFERFSEAHFPECFKEYADLVGARNSAHADDLLLQRQRQSGMIRPWRCR